jgi:ZIP family zinc transporter
MKVLLYVLFPVCAMMVGAIQHFAAGMVFAAVAIELLPDVVSLHAPLATILGFSLGVAPMLVMRCAERAGKNAAKETRDVAAPIQ